MSKKKKQKEKQQKKSYREQKLPGWMEDAEVLDIHRKAPMIRTISEVVYSQIIGKREARQLRMTVLIPDTGAAKPAVLFFPGGGWLGAAKDRFAENRWALAEAGFVVATAEYRTIPAGFPAQVVDGKTALRFRRAHAAFVLSRLKVFLFLLSPKSGNPLVKKQSLPILKSTPTALA